MKKSTLTLVATLLFSSLMFAHNGDPKPTTNTVPEVKTEEGVSLKDIFLSDYEGVTLFVDFQAVKDDVMSLNVIQEETIILADDVRQLPGDTIYELDLEDLKAGSYQVELKTAQGISIKKELIID